MSMEKNRIRPIAAGKNIRMRDFTNEMDKTTEPIGAEITDILSYIS